MAKWLSCITTTPETPKGEKKVGTKEDVWAGKATHWGAKGDRTIDDLEINAKGRVVNKKASKSSKARFDRTNTVLGPGFSTPMK